MMSVDLMAMKQNFTTMVQKVQPWILSHFMMWLDLKVAEYKVHGYMILDQAVNAAPRWLTEAANSQGQKVIQVPSGDDSCFHSTPAKQPLLQISSIHSQLPPMSRAHTHSVQNNERYAVSSPQSSGDQLKDISEEVDLTIRQSAREQITFQTGRSTVDSDIHLETSRSLLASTSTESHHSIDSRTNMHPSLGIELKVEPPSDDSVIMESMPLGTGDSNIGVDSRAPGSSDSMPLSSGTVTLHVDNRNGSEGDVVMMYQQTQLMQQRTDTIDLANRSLPQQTSSISIPTPASSRADFSKNPGATGRSRKRLDSKSGKADGHIPANEASVETKSNNSKHNHKEDTDEISSITSGDTGSETEHQLRKEKRSKRKRRKRSKETLDKDYRLKKSFTKSSNSIEDSTRGWTSHGSFMPDMQEHGRSTLSSAPHQPGFSASSHGPAVNRVNPEFSAQHSSKFHASDSEINFLERLVDHLKDVVAPAAGAVDVQEIPSTFDIKKNVDSDSPSSLNPSPQLDSSVHRAKHIDSPQQMDTSSLQLDLPQQMNSSMQIDTSPHMNFSMQTSRSQNTNSSLHMNAATHMNSSLQMNRSHLANPSFKMDMPQNMNSSTQRMDGSQHMGSSLQMSRSQHMNAAPQVNTLQNMNNTSLQIGASHQVSSPLNLGRSQHMNSSLQVDATALPPHTSSSSHPGASRHMDFTLQINAAQAMSSSLQTDSSFLMDSTLQDDCYQELYPRTGVIISATKLTAILIKGKGSGTKVIRLLLEHFFDDYTLAASCSKGTRDRPALNRIITEAVKGFAKEIDPKLDERAVNDAINFKCADTRKEIKKKFRLVDQQHQAKNN